MEDTCSNKWTTNQNIQDNCVSLLTKSVQWLVKSIHDGRKTHEGAMVEEGIRAQHDEVKYKLSTKLQQNFMQPSQPR